MDFLTPHAVGLFLGRAVVMTLPGLLVALLYPVMSTCRLRTGIMVGVAATIIAGVGLGWFMASGEAYNLMEARLAAEGRQIQELDRPERASADGWISGATRARAWRNWTYYVPAMIPLAALLSVLGWSIRRATRGR